MSKLIAQFGEGLKPLPADGGLAATIENLDEPAAGIELFISGLIGLITILASLAFLIFFILGAVNWITAGGDSGKLENARNQMIQGVIGIILVVGAYLIVSVISSFLGLNILNPADQIEKILGNSAGTSSTTSQQTPVTSNQDPRFQPVEE